jgi:4-hydroxy-tetrahydrodipicolinate synthase
LGGIVVDFGRLITAMVTPFDENLQINWKQVEKLIDYLIDEQKNDSLVICGTTGESPTLTEEEKLALFKFTVQYAKGRCKIIAGTGSNDTEHSIQLSQKAEALGVDGILLVAPYYNRPSQEGLYQHFKKIADSVNVPIILYNVPGRCGVNISAETTIRLSHISNIVATKDCTDLVQATQIIAGAEASFKLYTGEDSQTLPILAVGGYGVITVTGHVIGSEMKAMIESYLAGDVKKAAQIHAKLHPIFIGMFACPHPVPNPAPIKYALHLKGMNVGGLRLPLVNVTAEEGQFIQALFG